jgi:2-methylcitrate dehydratase PrpD
LEGRFGFFQAWLRGEFDGSAVTEGLGTSWLVPDIVFKPYPANHFTHAAIDAALELRKRGIRPDDVDRAVVGVPAPTLPTVGEPIDVKRRPETGYMAQFSAPYAVTAALFGGRGLGVSLADFSDELVRDPKRRALMERIDVVADEHCTDIFPRQFPAVLWVLTRDGRELSVEVMENRGGPARPLAAADIATKFRENVAGLLDSEAMAQVEATVANLAEEPDIGIVLSPIVPAGTDGR